MMKKMLILAAFLFAATACVPFAGLYLRAQRRLPMQEAVSAVAPYMIMYEDELCMTVFRAMSAGKTENSENVWVSALPYLTAADSSFDSSADSFTVSVRIEADAFAKGLEVYGFEPIQLHKKINLLSVRNAG